MVQDRLHFLLFLRLQFYLIQVMISSSSLPVSTSAHSCSVLDVKTCALECELSCNKSCSMLCMPACPSMCSGMCLNMCQRSGIFEYKNSSSCSAMSSTYVALDPVPQLLYRYPESSLFGKDTEIYAKFSNFRCSSLDDIQVSVISLESHLPLTNLGSPKLVFSGSSELALNLTISGSKMIRGLIQISVNCTMPIQTMTKFNFTFLDRPLVILGARPASIFVGNRLDANILIGNMMELPKNGFDYNLTAVDFILTDPLGVKRNLQVKVLFSNVDISSFVVSASSCDIAGIWRIEIISRAVSNPHAFVNVSVYEIPDPLITGWFPLECPFDTWEEVLISVSYFSSRIPGINQTSVTAVMVSEKGKPVDLDVKNIVSATPSCFSRDCSVSKIAVMTPVNGNPDNTTYDSIATVILYFKWYGSDGKLFNSTNSFTFKYFDANRARLESVFPKDNPVGGSAVSVIRMTNIQCSNLSLFFHYPINSAAKIHRCVEQQDKSIIAEFVAPTSQIIGTVLFNVSDGRNFVSGRLNYVSAPIQVVPADGPSTGGYSIFAQVTGWTNMTIGTTKAALIDLAQDSILDVKINSIEMVSNFSFIATLQVPAWTRKNGGQAIIRLQSQDGKYSSSGVFEFYQSPQVVAITPKRASINGQTTSLDRNTILIAVNGFPNVYSTDELLITFSNSMETIECDGSVCELISTRTSIDSLFLTVKVPKFSAGPCTISINYLALWPKQNRTVSVSFEYFIPKPLVSSVLYCMQCPLCEKYGPCPLCIQGGICNSTQELPLRGRAAINDKECLDGDACRGVIQVQVADAPKVDFDFNGLLNESSAVSCTFGDDGASMGKIRRIVSYFNGVLTLEFFPPPFQSQRMVTAMLLFDLFSPAPPTTVAFPVMFFDNKIQIYCAMGVCDGPSSGNSYLYTNVSNINLNETAAIESQIIVLFGNQSAQIISGTRASKDLTSLIIAPPALSENRDVIIGSKTVTIMIVWSSNRGIIASSQYTYWVAPRISKAQFSQNGESIAVLFDSNTNRGDQSFHERASCTGVINNVSLLGISPRCLWLADNQLVIHLGFGASIIPGSYLQVLNLRSFNHKSDLSSPNAVIQAPEFPMAPSLALKAPQMIDPCSPLELIAVSSSPHPLIYTWSSPNDARLSSVLSSVTSSTVKFPEGTPEMQFLDKNYTIFVQVTDFLGSQSNVVSVFVFKKSTPVPILTFSPPSLQILRRNAANVIGEALFSSCAGEKSDIAFSWSQGSGPTKIPSEFLIGLSQLRIPPNSLAPGSIYTLKLKAAMTNDESKAAEALYTIQVGLQPLVARIKGGGGEVWVGSSIVLDASLSRDLDLDSNEQQGLRFDWACSFHSPFGDLEPCSSLDGQILILPAASSVLIPSGTLSPTLPGSSYRFFVTVSKRGKFSARTSTSVRIVGENIPEASLIVDADANSFQSDGSVLMNADGRLVLRGSCGPESSSIFAISPVFGFSWSFDPPLDPVIVENSKYFPLGLQSSSMVMTGKDLDTTRMPSSRFTISLTCTDNDKKGTAGIAVEINSPPSGGKCEACLQGNMANCVKNGRPLADIFRMECIGWGDSMLPLQYRFGIQPLDNTNTSTWFSRSLERRIDFLLPTGFFNLMARVSDAFGAETTILYDTVSTVSSIGVRRADNNEQTNSVDSSLANVDIGMSVVNDLVKQGAAGKVNVVVSCLAIELNRISRTYLTGPLLAFNLSAVELRRETLFLTLMDTFKLSIPTSSYVCEAFGAAQQVIASTNLTKHTVLYAEAYAQNLANSFSETKIDQSCALSASEFIAAAIHASSVSTNMQEVGVKWLNSLEATVKLILNKASEELLPGEVLALTASSSHAEIWRVQLTGEQAEFNICQSDKKPVSTICTSYEMNVIVPRSVLNDLHFPSDQVFDVITNIFDSPPNLNSTTMAPLVIVHFDIPGKTKLSVHNLTDGIKLSIPHDHSASVLCAFWDPFQLSYSSAGIETIIDFNKTSYVHCMTYHLSVFTLIPRVPLQNTTTSMIWSDLKYSTTQVIPVGALLLTSASGNMTTPFGKNNVNLSLPSLNGPEELKVGLIVGLVTGFSTVIIAIATILMLLRHKKRVSPSESGRQGSVLESENTTSVFMGFNLLTTADVAGLDSKPAAHVPGDDATIIIQETYNAQQPPTPSSHLDVTLSIFNQGGDQEQEHKEQTQQVKENDSCELAVDLIFVKQMPYTLVKPVKLGPTGTSGQLESAGLEILIESVHVVHKPDAQSELETDAANFGWDVVSSPQRSFSRNLPVDLDSQTHWA